MPRPHADHDDPVVVAARAGDERAFAALVERHRRELRVHCYRMAGAVDDAEDPVQETFVRAWRHLGGFAGRATLRAWLYRIATNVCLDALERRSRRVLPADLAPGHRGRGPFSDGPAPGNDIAWLQPLPDHLWEPHDPDDGPDATVVSRETIELAFIAALQHLPVRRRAVFILRDVLGWSARQTAEHLELSESAVANALHRARTTMRAQLPRREDWVPSTAPTAEEWAVVRRYMAAVERADLTAVAELLAADVRAAMPPLTLWFADRDAVIAALTESWDPSSPDYAGPIRTMAVHANGQPGGAMYRFVPGGDPELFVPFAIGVARVEAGVVAELVAFHDPGLFARFGLPATLPAAG